MPGEAVFRRSLTNSGTTVTELNQSGRNARADAKTLSFAGNRLLATFSPRDRALLSDAACPVLLKRGQVLWLAGDEIAACYFPLPGTLVSIVLDLENGNSVDVATIGKEGAAGGIVSCGSAPAFGRAKVQIGGPAIRVEMGELEKAKARSPHIKSVFCRYADALLAQIMQSVACNAGHGLEARLCRWLLSSEDRCGSGELPLTQTTLAEMLGSQRTTINSILRKLHEQRAIHSSRGIVRVVDRTRLQALACECYDRVEQHFCSVLPPTKPQEVVDQRLTTGTDLS